ncbi:cilia- and flagella-associated protein 74 isoform X9 [Vulpes vulpes]|uniref:Cilia- and flagella-associated protein 74 isoform X9 n=1 Tax=Vulpes vulpes TaxID=9627 RepID=A0ABM4YA19_VULVU
MEEDASLFPKKELLDSVPLLEDEREDLEDPEYEAEFLPPEAENSTDLGYCCPQRKQSTDADKSKKRPAVPDRLKACHLRKTWSHLEKLREEKELFIQKSRGELRACRQRIDLITKQQASVAAEVAAGREANNTAAVGRLQAVSRRLCMELDNERDLQSKITALLQKSENTMWHLAIQEGQLEDVRKSAQEEEVTSRKYLREQAAKQLRKEEEASEKIKRNRLLRVRKSMCLQKDHVLRHQKLVEDAQKNHRIAVKFLKASLRRIREQEKEEEMKSREHMKRRMDAVLALKNSITANRETLRKFQAWSQAKADLAEQKAQAEKEMILAQGGDAFKQLFHQRRCEELEAQNRTFEEEQKLRKQEIINRILKEEAEEEKRKKKQSPPAPAMGQAPLREKTWSYITDICEGRDAVALPSFPGDKLQDGDRAEHPKASQFLEAISSESIQGDLRNVSWEDDTLAEPEIPGLWKEDYKPYQVPKEEADRKPVDGTKMDKDILARTMEKLRSRVTHKQVVSGHEFKGRPFNSKPKLIHFKDFDIGKVYKKKITLINATYTINYCKLVGVEEHLRDFIHIDFDPPGPMSAGMSCEVLVTFKPMINKDLEGNVSFLAQTGGFSVPLKCSTKKCTLSLDKELIDFGSYVVGETTSRIITLTNIGGLGTRFKFVRASESYEMDLSQSVMKISSLFTYEDKGSYEKIIISPSEQQMEGNESSPFDMQSQKESGKPDNKEQEEGHPTESEGVTMTTVMTIPPSEEQMEISLGEVTEGEIGPFSSIKVPVIFTPVTPGAIHSMFKVMFKNQQCPTLYFRVMGVAMDVPVWVPKPNVDLKICMYDRLYQDSVLVHTRSKAALRLKFEVCKELREHVELLPETGYIQAQSSYAVQLKFLPRHSLPEDAGKYFDKESRVLEAPMTIRVADQFVDIQPNDGFGTILPLETLQLDVIFQPTKAKEYSFELVCKSEINRSFKLACRAVSIHPPLELSHYQVKFAATSLYDTSVATLYIINSHVSINSLTHSVPRIGSEDAFPVGPTSFEFLLPPDAPITISPSVGTVSPGKAGPQGHSHPEEGPEETVLLHAAAAEPGPTAPDLHSTEHGAAQAGPQVQAQETLDIITKRGTLSLTLMGTGVASMITCSIEGDVLDMGYVVARESVSSSFKLQNCSALPIKFSLQLDSLSPSRSKGQQQLPQFLTSPAQRTEVVGTQNHSGQSVFSVIPVEGIMDPGKAQDFTVTFSPDHESLYFSDRLQVMLFEKKLSHQILLKGAAREHMMFVEGGDPLDVPVESLTVIPTYDPEHREEAEELKPILVTLDYIQLDTDTPAPPATRELQVGCIRTTQLSPKKSVEFSLDSSTSLQHKGFTIEPSRGSVERGQTKTISISWMPPADFDVGATDSGQEACQNQRRGRMTPLPHPGRELLSGQEDHRCVWWAKWLGPPSVLPSHSSQIIHSWCRPYCISRGM